jgi:murein DD-endopeptidase MepM/ murein hydrolase activator NlpD
MADEPESGIPVHRPLPSVGMPLLRDDVRASRHKQLILALLLVLVAALAGAGAMLVPGAPGPPAENEPVAAATGPAVPLGVGFVPPHDAGPPIVDAGPPPPPPEPIAIEPAEEPGITRTVHAFGRASGFRSAVIAAGLGGEEADAITGALTGVMDFRRCRPDHHLVVERDAAGGLRRFEYRASITQIYEAALDGTRWVGRVIEVPIERVRLARGGVVQSSLGAALEQAGLGRTLVGVFVETFEQTIDFNTETRTGDAFRILVDEERIDGQFLRYGAVAALEYRSQRRGLMRAFWFETRAPSAGRPGDGDFHDENGRAVHGGWLRTPLRYDHVSSPFNPRRMHPVLRRIMPHNGIDYAAGTGTPVWSAADGVITFIGPRGANGNLVSISHEGGYESHYAHLSRFASGLVRGATVRQRQVIGYVGSTGRSTGPHLHFGLERNGAFVDPARELNGPGRVLPGGQLARFRAQLPALRAALDAIVIPEVAVVAPAADEERPAAVEGAMD